MRVLGECQSLYGCSQPYEEQFSNDLLQTLCLFRLIQTQAMEVSLQGVGQAPIPTEIIHLYGPEVLRYCNSFGKQSKL